MKILITGATGFVGSYLVPELLRRGAPCRLLVRSVDKARSKFPEGVEFVQGNVTQPESLVGVAEGITHVVHLAALGHVCAISKEAYREFLNVNVQGTRNLLNACTGVKIKSFVHFSSTAALGLIRKQGRIDENDAPQPSTPYQKSKFQSEEAALERGRELGIPVVVLRPCMIYGIGGFGEFYKIAKLMRKGMFPKVGRGSNLTPLVHVHDVVGFTCGALERGRPQEVYLVASNRSLPLDELRRLIMKSWGSKAIYLYIPKWLMFTAAWGFELVGRILGKAPLVTRRNIASTVVDREFSIEKAKNELSYKPSIDFEDGIAEVVNWFKGQVK